MTAILQISVALLALIGTSNAASDRYHVAEACSAFICDVKGVKPGVSYCAPLGSKYAGVSCVCKQKGVFKKTFEKLTHSCSKGLVFNIKTGNCVPDTPENRKPCEDYWRTNPMRWG